MSFSNVNREKKFSDNGFKNKLLLNDYFDEKLQEKSQIRSEISERKDVINLSRQITLATLINQTQIKNEGIGGKEVEIIKKIQNRESISISHKQLQNALIERRLKSRKKSKIFKNQRRRPVTFGRNRTHDQRAKCKKKFQSREDTRRKVSETPSKETVCVESEIPKRGKRGLVGGKAKANPPNEDSNDNYDSDEDADTFYFYRISLGYFQKFRDMQGASTSNRYEMSTDKTPQSFKTGRLEAKTSEEMELLELQRWGMASLISYDKLNEKTNKLGVNESADFKEEETDLSRSCDRHVNNGLSQTLGNINKSLRAVNNSITMNCQRRTELLPSLLQCGMNFKSESLRTGGVDYKWSQTFDGISIEIKCPLHVVSSNQISIKTTPLSIEINITSSNESEWKPFLNWNLAGRIFPDESSWCLGAFSGIIIYLKKANNDFWQCLGQPQTEPFNIAPDELKTDLLERHQLSVLDIINNFSSFEISDSRAGDPLEMVGFITKESEARRHSKELNDVKQRDEKFEKIERFD